MKPFKKLLLDSKDINLLCQIARKISKSILWISVIVILQTDKSPWTDTSPGKTCWVSLLSSSQCFAHISPNPFSHFRIFFLLTLVVLPPKACTSNSTGADSPQATGAQLPCITQNFGMRYNPEFSHEIRLQLPSLEHQLKSYPYLASSPSLSSFSPSFLVSPRSTSGSARPMTGTERLHNDHMTQVLHWPFIDREPKVPERNKVSKLLYFV